MRDVNIQLWKVGVTAKTQHNEVAPAQHELAPIYSEAKYCSRSEPAHNADVEESCMPAWNEVPAS